MESKLYPGEPEVLLWFKLTEDKEAEHFGLELGPLDVNICCYEGSQAGELGYGSELVGVDVHPFGNGLLDEKRASFGERNSGEHEFYLRGKFSEKIRNLVGHFLTFRFTDNRVIPYPPQVQLHFRYRVSQPV